MGKSKNRKQQRPTSNFIASLVGFTPGLTPFSHDSVAQIISGLR
jgi:hypothetical protein